MAISEYTNNIVEITNILTDEEIKSLATTITGGLLKNKINSREDTLKAILNYSGDIRSILRRKVFTREKLLSYLYDKNVSVILPITKHDIIEKILEFWGCGKFTTEGRTQIIEKEYSDELSSDEETNIVNREILQASSSIGCSKSTRDEHHMCKNSDQQIIGRTYTDESSIIKESNQDIDYNVSKTVKLLAEQFSDWFYKLLNANELSPEHFFPDGVLNLVLALNGDVNTKNVCNDPIALTDTLISVKNQFNLFFNPNLMEECLKTQMDPHGLVSIIVGGTLHINSVCVGVFEQMFALARDPTSENNWKIKRTDLRLTNGSRLGNSEIEDSDCKKIL
ncbi:uncharacterized protein C3orf38 homolog [Harmonia axyridis]|uniref:uncharacterized protein C3orf38 homolog n=1 Tax=Harmonia axyridis TaxID=115357 RepID=UPI001E279CE8|nr:uncharacterized protein C3orf38 homolog [Harmonia axyridis]